MSQVIMPIIQDRYRMFTPLRRVAAHHVRQPAPSKVMRTEIMGDIGYRFGVH